MYARKQRVVECNRLNESYLDTSMMTLTSVKIVTDRMMGIKPHTYLNTYAHAKEKKV